MTPTLSVTPSLVPSPVTKIFADIDALLHIPCGLFQDGDRGGSGDEILAGDEELPRSCPRAVKAGLRCSGWTAGTTGGVEGRSPSIPANVDGGGCRVVFSAASSPGMTVPKVGQVGPRFARDRPVT